MFRYAQGLSSNYILENFVAEIETKDHGVAELALWDTDEYSHLNFNIYHRLDAILLCFSIEYPSSLCNVSDKWIPKVLHFCPGRIPPCIVVGLKKDLREDQGSKNLVSYKQGEAMAKQAGAYAYVECSSKTGEGVQEVFEAAVQSTLSPSKRSDKGCIIM
jgi:Ras homolog gene family, member A